MGTRIGIGWRRTFFVQFGILANNFNLIFAKLTVAGGKSEQIQNKIGQSEQSIPNGSIAVSDSVMQSFIGAFV